MDQSSGLGHINHYQAPGLADSDPDKLYSLLYSHQIAFHRHSSYYCWHSARIYNQYKALNMIEEYYKTLERVRSDLHLRSRNSQRQRKSSITSRHYH